MNNRTLSFVGIGTAVVVFVYMALVLYTGETMISGVDFTHGHPEVPPESDSPAFVLLGLVIAIFVAMFRRFKAHRDLR